MRLEELRALPAAGHEQAVLGPRVECGIGMADAEMPSCPSTRAAALAQGHSPRQGRRTWRDFVPCRPQAMSKRCSDRASNGCPAWIRTMTRRVKVACATITPPGSGVRKGHGAAWGVAVKSGKSAGVARARFGVRRPGAALECGRC